MTGALAPERRLEPGERLVVAYKAGKSVVELILAVVLAAVITSHGVPELRESVTAFIARIAWLSRVADVHAIAGALTDRSVEVTALVVFLDSLSSAFEGWAVHTGRRWGAWIVVVATSLFLPFEIAAIVHRPHALEVLAFCVNLAIVVYLSGRAGRSRSTASSAIEKLVRS